MTLADDKLEGIDAIVAYLGQDWTRSRIYEARRKRALPIHKMPVVGMYAFRSELERALKDPATLTPDGE